MKGAFSLQEGIMGGNDVHREQIHRLAIVKEAAKT
jgi:hypothetical protein